MPKFYFTFGINHRDRHGQTLCRAYVEVEADNMHTARSKIADVRGNKWSNVYTSEKDAGVDQFDLFKLSIEDVRL